MNCRVLVAGMVVLVAGCIPVTEPVGDIDKAEPDQRLVGTWKQVDGEDATFIVDVPAIKGNPRGLMRATRLEKGQKREDASADSSFWFFTATIGKRSFANFLLVQGDRHYEPAQLGNAGDYASWAKNDKRGFGIAPYSIDGKKVIVWYADNHGENRKLDKLLKENGITAEGGIYRPKPGWLKKELEKGGLEGIFLELGTYERVNK